MRLVTFSLYVVVMYFVKLSILLLYLRVFTIAKKLRIMTWITILVVTAYSLAGLIGTITRCNPSKGACDNVTHLSIISSVLNILTDIAILILPIRQVWKLQVSTKQRIGVLFVFALGSLYVVQRYHGTQLTRPVSVLSALGAFGCTLELRRARMIHGMCGMVASGPSSRPMWA